MAIRPVDPLVSEDAAGQKTVTRCYSYRKGDDWESDMPDPGDTGDVGEPEEGLTYAGYGKRDGEAYIEIDIMWGAGATLPALGSTVWRFGSQSETIPLQQHPDFLMNWVYDLYQNDASTAVTPAWHATATNGSDADGIEYAWAQQPPGAGWRKIEDRTKDADSYLVPRVTSISEKMYAGRSAAGAGRVAVATIATPAEAWSVSGGSWLVIDSHVEPRGRGWVAVTTYLHSPAGWDTDLY